MSGHDHIDDGILRRNEQRVQRQVSLVAGMLGDRRSVRVVDLGCGEGVHLAGLLALGHTNLCGIDLDAPSLEQARSRVPGADWRLGDAYRLMPPCDMAFAFFGSFGCGERRDVLADAHTLRAKVAVGGCIVLDLVNRDFYASPVGVHRWLDDGITTIAEQCRLDHRTGDLATSRIYRGANGTKIFHYVQRAFAESEIRTLLTAVGFHEIEVSANECGEQTSPIRQRLVVVAR